MSPDRRQQVRNAQKRYEENHPDARRRVWRERMLRKREFFAWLKSIPCFDCDRSFPTCAMDFDHVRGTKVRNIARLHTASPEVIQEELVKCDIVCANCHRIRTWVRKTQREAHDCR